MPVGKLDEEEINQDLLKDALEEIKEPPATVMVDASHQPMTQEKKKPFTCDQCGQGFGVKFNLKRHFELKHKGHQSKYMKHIKKDGKYQCKSCSKLYSHPTDLKRHYRTAHTEKNLKLAGVEAGKAITFTRKTIKQHGPKTSM